MTAKKKPITSPAETADSVTGGQRKQYDRFVEDARDRAWAELELDKDSLQRLFSRGGEFQARIVAAIKELVVGNEYANEEVKSSRRYPSAYKSKSFAEQVAILRRHFPKLGSYDEAAVTQPVPKGAEAHFAVPRWELLASTYGEAVELVLGKIAESRPFKNWRQGELGSNYLCQHVRAVAAFKRIGEVQKGHDILVVSSQFGLRHAGRSVRRARAVFTAEEFGLGSFAVGCMILTHPERFTAYEDLCIDCAGDEYAPSGDGGFSNCLLFRFHGDGLYFGSSSVSNPDEDFGSSSAFSAA